MLMSKEESHLETAYKALFQQDYLKAIQYFKQAIRINPGNAKIYYLLSITYGRNNRIQEALQEMCSALRLEPDNSTYHLHFRMLLARYLYEIVLNWTKQQREVSLIQAGIEQIQQLDDVNLLHSGIKMLQEWINEIEEEINEPDQSHRSRSIWEDGTGSMQYGGRRRNISTGGIDRPH